MRAGAHAGARAQLEARLAPWRRAAAFVAACACVSFGLAAFVAAWIAHRHDLAFVGATHEEVGIGTTVVAAATGLCAATCAWLELGARRRTWTERLDDRLGLQGALCAAVEGVPTRLSDALARGLDARLSRAAMAGLACAPLWPASFVLAGSGAAWLASEAWLARTRVGPANPSSTTAALADELQRAALEARSPDGRARLAKAAASARHLSAVESEGTDEQMRRIRAELLDELRELELSARDAPVGTQAGWPVAAARARQALEAQSQSGLARGEAGDAGAKSDGSPSPAGRTTPSSEHGGEANAAGGHAGAPGSSRSASGAGATGLASGARGGTISTPNPSRGPLRAPTIFETLPAHEAAWLSEWALRARASDAPPR